MKTFSVTQDEMKARVSKFKDLKCLSVQTDKSVPLAALDVVYSRKLMPVIGLASGEVTALTEEPPIVGAGGMTITLAACPKGTGPGLHNHVQTYETFTVLQGTFEFRWNDDGGETIVLTAFDTIAVPPGVCRAFTSIGEEEGILQVIITGGAHDMNDLDFTPETAEKIKAISPKYLEVLATKGMQFTAGKK